MQVNRKKVTMRDIASQLGISLATVQRALNGKGNVSESTRKIVWQTAGDLGYHFDRLSPNAVDMPVNIAILLRNVAPEFQSMIEDGVNTALFELSNRRVRGRIIRIEPQDYGRSLQENLLRVAEEGYDGVVFYTYKGITGQELSITERLREKNIKMATIYTDEGVDQSYMEFAVMPDAERAGRIAAELLSMQGLGPGTSAVVFLGQREFQLHRNYLSGFAQGCEICGIRIADVIEHRDDERIAYYAADQLLIENPNINGIYCCTGVTSPICRRVRELGLQDKITIIGTEVMDETAEYIRNGTLSATLFMDPFKMGYEAVRGLYYAITGCREVEKRIMITPKIVIRANIDCYINSSCEKQINKELETGKRVITDAD